MTPSAVIASTQKMVSWTRIRLVRRISRPLIPAVRSEQWVARSARTARVARVGELADRAAPLQLQPRQVALPPRSGEESRVDAAQRQIKDQRQVRVVAAHPVGERLLGEREGGQEAQRAGQC